jgi:hypothetical protein
MIVSRRILRLTERRRLYEIDRNFDCSKHLARRARSIADTALYLRDLGPVSGAPGQAFSVNRHDVISGAAVLADGASHAMLWYKGWQFDISQSGLGGQNSIAFCR